jgi:Zn finger protein HypA/HybF involved in hydrogenase expression
MENVQPEQTDMNRELMLDGNAVAGILQEIFTAEMTASPTECANCGREGELGTLLAFTQAPGVVLRCPACESVMVRIVQTPDAIYLDARGTVHLRLERRSSQR